VLFAGSFIESRSSEKNAQVQWLFDKMITPLVRSRSEAVCSGAIRLVGCLTAICGLLLLQMVWFVESQRLFIVIFSLCVTMWGILIFIRNKNDGNE
jgi:hypothetical protein